MGKILALDYGKKRIGVAVCDGKGGLVFPRAALQNKGDWKVVQFLKDLIGTEHITTIVVGIPIGLEGEETAQTRLVRKFVVFLRKHLSVRILEEDEALSTFVAEEKFRAFGLKSHEMKSYKDSVAAAAILETFLERKSRDIL